MNGWLRGVVARSRGAGAVLRPALASRGLTVWRDDTPPIESPATPQAQALRTTAAVAEPAAPVGARAEARAHAQPQPHPHPQPQPHPHPHPSLAASPTRAEALKWTAPAVRPQLPSRVEPPPTTTPQLEQPDTPALTMPAVRVALPPMEARAVTRSRTETSVPPIRPALPARASMAAAPAGARAAALAAQARAFETAAPAPDVHIHIGRIELTALTAPEPRRTTGAPAHKPMSLDDYLGRRDREHT